MRLYPVDDEQLIPVKLQIERDRRVRMIPLKLILDHYHEKLSYHKNNKEYSQAIQEWAKEAIKTKKQIALKRLRS